MHSFLALDRQATVRGEDDMLPKDIVGAISQKRPCLNCEMPKDFSALAPTDERLTSPSAVIIGKFNAIVLCESFRQVPCVVSRSHFKRAKTVALHLEVPGLTQEIDCKFSSFPTWKTR